MKRDDSIGPLNDDQLFCFSVIFRYSIVAFRSSKMFFVEEIRLELAPLAKWMSNLPCCCSFDDEFHFLIRPLSIFLDCNCDSAHYESICRQTISSHFYSMASGDQSF